MWQSELIFLFKILPEKGKKLLLPVQEKKKKSICSLFGFSCLLTFLYMNISAMAAKEEKWGVK